MYIEDIVIEIRNKARDRVGVLDMDDIEKIEAYPFFNNVGRWELEVSSSLEAAQELRQPGAGIIIWNKDKVYMSGPMEDFDFIEAPDDAEGTFLFRGVSDDIRGADALAYPDPLNADVSTQAVSHDVRSGNCETVMRDYVRFNIGPNAQVSRQIANLEVDPLNLNRGANVIGRARFDVLGKVLSDVAAVGGLGFRFVQDEDGPEIFFRVFEPQDRRSEISLDVKNEQLESGKYSLGSLTLWRPIIAGQGEGAERRILEVRNTTADGLAELWDRYPERFIDRRDTENDEELIQEGTKALAEEGIQRTSLRVVPSEDLDVEYEQDWYLGDLITVVVDGQPLVSQVNGAALKIDSAGLQHGIVIGEPGGFDYEARMAAQQAKQEKRLAALERNEPESNTGAGVQIFDSLPAGSIINYASDGAIPSNFLVCNGNAISRTTYAALFAAIGTTYGAGDGSTTFNLPNFLGKSAFGYNPSETEFNAMGKTGGAKTHTLTIPEMPAHTHPPLLGNNFMNGYVGVTGIQSGTGKVAGDAGAAPPSTGAEGGGQPHNNLPPYLAVRFLIKFTNAQVPADSALEPTVNALVSRESMRKIKPASVTVNSGSASIAADGLITATGWNNIIISEYASDNFDRYKITWDILYTSAACDIEVALREGSVDLGGTNYNTRVYRRNASGDSSLSLNSSRGMIGRSDGGYGSGGWMEITTPARADYKKINLQSIDANWVVQGGIMVLSNTIQKSLRLFLSGSATANATRIRIYGYND